MTIDLTQFSALQKTSKASFFEQQKLIRQIMAGKTVLCKTCQQPLKLSTRKESDFTGIRCTKKCTDIALDFA